MTWEVLLYRSSIQNSHVHLQKHYCLTLNYPERERRQALKSFSVPHAT